MNDEPQAPLDVKLIGHDLRILTNTLELTEAQARAVFSIANRHGWFAQSTADLERLLWGLFRYYVLRTQALEAVANPVADPDMVEHLKQGYGFEVKLPKGRKLKL